MKVGDLVKLKSMHRRQAPRAGLIVDLIEKKCWRTDVFGNKIDWGKIDPEPHAVVIVNGNRLTIPMTDLEAMDESR
tara:strand:- start:752 stop:979 length:228 start_codon:yes stop_codon:yes gene_type:complete